MRSRSATLNPRTGENTSPWKVLVDAADLDGFEAPGGDAGADDGED